MKTIVLTKLDQKLVSAVFYCMSEITKNISEDIDQHDKDLYPLETPLWGWGVVSEDRQYHLRLQLAEMPNEYMVSIPLSLLEDIRHELVTLSGLQAFDKPDIAINHVKVDFDEIIRIDTKKLVEKIDEWLP